jgi:hypothetical protein
MHLKSEENVRFEMARFAGLHTISLRFGPTDAERLADLPMLWQLSNGP